MKHSLLESEILRDTHWQSHHVLLKPVGFSILGIIAAWYFAFQYGITDQFGNLFILISLGLLGYAIKEIIMWRKSKYLITNQRLIKISHDGIFKYTVTETTLDRILNVGFRTTGLGSAIGKYGDVEIQSVGLVEPIVFAKIKHPEKIKEYIWLMHTRYTQRPVIQNQDISHLQQEIGYTKKDQRIL